MELKRLISPLLLCVALVLTVAVIRPKPTGAQATVLGYVFDGGVGGISCGDAVNYTTGDVNPGYVGDLLATMYEGIWYYAPTYEYSQPDGSGDAVNSKYYSVCSNAEAVTRTIEYNVESAASGGYLVDATALLRQGVTNLEQDAQHDGDAVGGGCFSVSASIGGTQERWVNTANGLGFHLRAYTNVAEAFCNESIEMEHSMRFRLLGYNPTPTPTPAATCPPGYYEWEGECVDAACYGVTCGVGEVCIQGTCVDEQDGLPGRMGVDDCINYDPELWDDPAWINPPGSMGNGLVELYGDEYIRSFGDYELQGPYRITIRAQSPIETALTYPLYDDASGGEYEWYIENDGQWHQWQGDFNFFDPTYINLGLLVDGGYSSEVLGVSVDFVCVEPIEIQPTGTPSPIPTATPGAPCDNPDPYFDFPSMWFVENGTVQNGAVYLNPGGYARIPTDLTPGNYHAVMIYQSWDNGNSVDVRQGSWRDTISLYGDGTGHSTDWWFNMSDTGSGLLFIQTPYENAGQIRIATLCISRHGDIQPTSTPEPTNTPGGPTSTATTIPHTPTGTPSGGGGGSGACLNQSSMTQPPWSISGGGSTIADGVATLVDGGTLYAVVDSDMAQDYLVSIWHSSNTGGEMIFNWRGERQPVNVSSGGDWRMIIVSSQGKQSYQQMAPLQQRPQNVQPGMSPLSLPQLHNVSPLQAPPLRLAADNILVIENTTGGTLYVGDVCITPTDIDDDGGTDLYDIDIFHPVCEGDFFLQTAFDEDVMDAIIVGPGEREGMPVHAIMPGVVAMHGDWLSLEFGGEVHEGCVIVEHSALLNKTVQSVYCGLSEFIIPGSNQVDGGQIIGYVGDALLLTFGLQVEDDWVDPTPLLEIYSDCYPYLMIFDELPPCGADNGNELVPERYNDVWPGWRLSSIPDYFPWLVHTIYDVVGYPILCALVPLFNGVMGLIVSAANTLIAALSPVFIFLYRISMLFEYAAAKIKSFFVIVFGVVNDLIDLMACSREVVRYLVEGIRYAADGENAMLISFEDDTVLFGVLATSQLLLNSRIATFILTPFTVLFIAYSGWRLFPWMIRTIMGATGLVSGGE